jgi:hypothetical protein
MGWCAIRFKESFFKRLLIALHLIIHSELLGKDIKIFYNGVEIKPPHGDSGKVEA